MAKKRRHTREYKLQAVQMVIREKRKIVDVAASSASARSYWAAGCLKTR